MELYVSTTKVWNIEFDDSDFIDFFECGYCREKNRNRKLFSLPSLDPRGTIFATCKWCVTLNCFSNYTY